ncbi:ATP-binding protein [Hymenobacter negativus]|uniref:histidine kinase n=1 Tax=Hymenobacter negativus TaxID=2795026 RepID=A0ABS3QAH4_9BACT|nr:ATP-binding protein [Hymenobacter negativus]MBO2008255.1 response regulator [Hymenobacter negativus]
MSLKVTLAAERLRREAAEAEVAKLRAQLAALTAATPAPSTEEARSLAQVVSQLKYTEQQLEDQQGLVRQVIDNSPNLVYVEDENGRLILANETYVQLLNQQAPPESRPATPPPPAAHANMEAGTAVSFEECYYLTNGQVLWFSTTKSPLVRSDGSRYLLTFSSDITDLKRAYQIAEESVRAKQVFMANMSHEIRTPLHGVMGLAELLKKAPLSAEQADYVDMIQSSTENLLVVINDILDFSKIESGKIRLERIPFDIAKTVQAAVRSLAFKTDEKGLILNIIGLNDHIPLAQGDPFRLHQVLVNLISNAIKFTNRGSITITVDASRRHGQDLPVTFSIADTGIGISEGNLGQVFKSFRQADSSIPRLYGGTGLGLSICKNLVELQGGHIGVRSTLGQGSCFSFTIPYRLSEEHIIQEVSSPIPTNSLQGLSLLLAEDNGVNQLIAVSMLGQWQVNVDMAQNGEEALAKALNNQYDLILMDIQMPQLDGIEATGRLRATAGPNRYTPVIALTADAFRVNAESCQALGFSDYLIKPYTEQALYQMLARVSHRPAEDATPAVAVELVPESPLLPADPSLHYDFLLLGKLATDTDFVRKILEMFVSRVPDQMQSLHAALEVEDWKTVAREAHSLKSTFGSLNIQPETQHLKRLEELAENQPSASEAQKLVGAVAQATQQFCALFQEELAQLSQPL